MTAQGVPTLDVPPDRRGPTASIGRTRPAPSSGARILGLSAALAAIYFAAGKTGLSMAAVNPSASAVWPPTGISIAAVLLFGPALWPGIFVGAFLVNATSAGTLFTSLGIACGNTLEGVVGAWLVQRLANGRHAFERTADVFRYAFLSSAGAVISATLGVTTLASGGFVAWEEYGAVWSTWWLGDLVSAWIVAPFIIEWWAPSDRDLERRRLAELALLTACLLAVVLLAFFLGPIAAGTRRNPFTFLYLPPLVWAAFRFPRRIVATATLLLSAGAVLATHKGIGPFTSGDENITLLFLQSFMGVVAITALAVCATVSESRRAEQDLRRRSEELRRSNEELEQYAMVASHDLQEPLRMTSSYLQLLERRCNEKLASEEREYMRHALESAGRMRDLIDGLLAYSRVDSGATFARVDCEAALGRALDNLRVATVEAQATITRHPLPEVLGDQTQLAQLFQNLVGNALKFRQPGLPVHVGIEVRPLDG